MKKMTKFNEGWWNCFLSYTDGIVSMSCWDAIDYAKTQMSSAGVKKEEIDYVLKNDYIMSEGTKEILKEYKKEHFSKKNTKQ